MAGQPASSRPLALARHGPGTSTSSNASRSAPAVEIVTDWTANAKGAAAPSANVTGSGDRAAVLYEVGLHQLVSRAARQAVARSHVPLRRRRCASDRRPPGTAASALRVYEFLCHRRTRPPARRRPALRGRASPSAFRRLLLRSPPGSAPASRRPPSVSRVPPCHRRDQRRRGPLTVPA